MDQQLARENIGVVINRGDSLDLYKSKGVLACCSLQSEVLALKGANEVTKQLCALFTQMQLLISQNQPPIEI